MAVLPSSVRCFRSWGGRCYLLNLYASEPRVESEPLIERMSEIVALMEVLAKTWPETRLAVLSISDELGDEVDTITACDYVWPTAFALRAD